MRRIVLASLLLAAAASASACSSGPELDTSGPQTIEVAGVTFSYECRGEGSPVAFVEDGLHTSTGSSSFDPEWYGWEVALDGMSDLTTVCIYGRRGIGGTDPLDHGSVRTTNDQVDDFESLLGALGVDAPVVLIGHSIAGFNLRVAADRSSSDVVGLVFVDATSPGLLEHVPPPASTSAPEWLDISTSGEQVAATGDLGDTPIYVITSGENESRDDFWGPLQAELAAASTNSQRITSPDASHYVFVDDPQAVIDGLAWVLQELG
jgi:pimeloyl-ACP methyl ester carboxylesterase